MEAEHYACASCALAGGCLTPRMEPDEVNLEPEFAADVMFVGEAPGAAEDRQGTPFVGPSGRLLRDVVEHVGLQHYGLVYTNVCRCRPPDNKTPGAKQIRTCAEAFLWDEIDEYDPAVVVLLGNTPLKAVLGESGITNWRGVTVDRDGRVFVPTFHPAYILRNNSALMELVQDLEKVESLVSGADEIQAADDDYEWTVVNSPEAAEDMLNAVSQANTVSFDTEITSLRPFDDGVEFIMCSLAVDHPSKRAWVVPGDNVDAMEIVLDILDSPYIHKIGHNMKFDALAAWALLGTWINGVSGDSMLLSYIIDSQPGRHGLKVLSGRFLGMYDYDKPVQDYLDLMREADPSKGGDFSLVPNHILEPYAAKDAIATLELHKRLLGELTRKQRILYDQLVMPASNTLAQMEANGCVIDRQVAQDYIELYEAEQARQFTDMEAHPIFQKYVRDRRKKDDGYEFNPNSVVQVRDLLYGRKYFGLEPIGTTKTGLPSTKWDYLKEYAKDVPWLNHYRYYRLLGKMLGTYLRPSLDGWPSTSDGRVRSSYRLHGTVTGRLASRNPNLQNIPTPEKEPGTILESHPIKDIFTHTHPDGHIMAVDYSGMELRTMASVSGCVEMARAFEEDKDVHSMVTCALFGYEYDDFMECRLSDDEEIAAHAKAQRYKAKWVNWTLLYGGSEYTLHRLYGLDKDEALELINLYYGMFPEVLSYKDKTLAFARAQGFVESPFGRRRYLPYINDKDRGFRSRAEREAINMPIQSAASDVLVCALIVIDEAMQDRGFESLMVNTVHDSVMFDVWPGELEPLAVLCRDVMENITVPGGYGAHHFPGLDFSWFTVPLKADFEVGHHYGSLEHYNIGGR